MIRSHRFNVVKYLVYCILIFCVFNVKSSAKGNILLSAFTGSILTLYKGFMTNFDEAVSRYVFYHQLQYSKIYV